ncbi:hypothetical protein V6N13_061421 [Hibiscus sabdariffa]
MIRGRKPTSSLTIYHHYSLLVLLAFYASLGCLYCSSCEVGASSGIGIETTRVLALRGVHVIMALRNVDVGRNVKEAILKEIRGAKVEVMELDLSSMASVRKFASEYRSSNLPLNLLIYSAWSAYEQSKLANILHAKELARRLKEDVVEITANSVHPGAIMTNLAHHLGLINSIGHMVGKYFLKNVQQNRHRHPRPPCEPPPSPPGYSGNPRSLLP